MSDNTTETEAPVTEPVVEAAPAAPEAPKSFAHECANTLNLILNGNVDPRTLSELHRDSLRTFLGDAANALAKK